MSQMTPESWNGDQYDAEAQRLYEAGDYDGALRVLRDALDLHPDSVELLVSMGYTRLAREEYPWARKAFESSLAHEPGHEEALAGLGEVLLKLGERAGAFLAFERILELSFDDDLELMLCVGRSLLREGLLERAERFFRLAVAADDSSAEAVLDLAYVLYRRDESEEAVDWAREAVRLEPGFEEARALYGNLLYEKGEFGASLAQLERIPPGRITDPLVAWRIVELTRQLRDLPADSEQLIPYLVMLDELSVDPSPEDRLIAEVEAMHGGSRTSQPTDVRNQLDLFGRPPIPVSGGQHRVRGADGAVYEGDWTAIVRAMRDRSADPSASVADFMRCEAKRLHDLTGVRVSSEDPRTFLEESARIGALEIEC
jgi:Flp pilus assembly protein TadD